MGNAKSKSTSLSPSTSMPETESLYQRGIVEIAEAHLLRSGIVKPPASDSEATEEYNRRLDTCLHKNKIEILTRVKRECATVQRDFLVGLSHRMESDKYTTEIEAQLACQLIKTAIREKYGRKCTVTYVLQDRPNQYSGGNYIEFNCKFVAPDKPEAIPEDVPPIPSAPKEEMVDIPDKLELVMKRLPEQATPAPAPSAPREQMDDIPDTLELVMKMIPEQAPPEQAPPPEPSLNMVED